MERLFADSNGRVRQDEVEPLCGIHGIWRREVGVLDAVVLCVGLGEVDGPKVDIDTEHLRCRGPLGCSKRYRPVAAPEIEDAGDVWRDGRVFLQEIAGTGIDFAAREDAAICGQRKVHIGKNQLDRFRIRSDARIVVKVVAFRGAVGVVVPRHGRNRTPVSRYPGRVSAPYRIRHYGDPVLKQVAKDVTDIDGALVRLVEDMLETMYDEPGLGLAAPQVGVRKRLFVYDLMAGEDPRALINPEIVESDGEWEFEEGCLSVPGLSWNIVRPKQVLVRGVDLDGNEIEIEADELEARLFQHELDHLNGVLLVEHLDDEQKKDAKRILRQRAEAGDSAVSAMSDELGLRAPKSTGLSLP